MDVALGTRTFARYLCAVTSVAVALALTWFVGAEEVGLTPLFFAAVMFSAWYGGLGPGLVATVLAGLSSAYFFASPPLSLIIGADDIIREAVFVCVAILISYLTGRTRQSQERLRQARAEAESANRAKDDFLAVLSHELRNPLNPVLAAASLHERDPSLPETVREDLAMIRRNVEIEVRLIDDLLDLNRIGRGKLNMRFEPADLHELVDDVIRICRDEVAAKNVRLVIHQAATNPRVSGDAARLRQVVWNLLKNAVKFTPPGGTITLATRDLDGGRIELAVADTGIGIEPQVLQRIFLAFDQGDPRVARHFGGLGLSISRMLVELHGGSIEAASDGRGKGATFTVRLPTLRKSATAEGGADQAAAVSASTVGGPADAQRRLRILLVEDDEDTRRILTKLLRGRYDVCPAAGVTDALQAASRQPFDLVVADLGLPDGSGLELMIQLRQHHQLPGIALTGYGTQDDVLSTRRAGFIDHLTKPVDLQRLDSAIRGAINQSGKPKPEPPVARTPVA